MVDGGYLVRTLCACVVLVYDACSSTALLIYSSTNTQHIRVIAADTSHLIISISILFYILFPRAPHHIGSQML